MKIGCPKEIKNNEFRVGLTPNAAQAYVSAGHSVFIEESAGLSSAISDDEYKTAGAAIVGTAAEVWNAAEMLIKVKEPLESECDLMRENQLVYTYFHFAADKPSLDAGLKRKIIAVVYETVQEGGGSLLLKPMSEVAGRMASLMGVFYSTKTQVGRGAGQYRDPRRRVWASMSPSSTLICNALSDLEKSFLPTSRRSITTRWRWKPT
ncbi:MAG: hypothetical protein LBD58_08705 [Treponema sp.]|jgi:alanine dehydrogenase|nr:hypothetical protein [Treponema sp.]